MNLWILKHDNSEFPESYSKDLEGYVQTISQLELFEKLYFSKDSFHFLSFTSKGTPKTYNRIEKDSVKGYSGLLIDNAPECTDMRNINNVDVSQPEAYYGQFSLYSLTDEFYCSTDVLGFHKVFYGVKNGVKYVSNSFEFMQKLGVFEVNIEQMLKDLATVRFGIFPGYNTLLKEVYTLPEYGSMKITAGGEILVGSYKDISELLLPRGNFEEKLKEAVSDYKIIANYLMKYHHTAIGLSGGFDGRLILNMFAGTAGKKLETFTYNRAGKLDLIIASILSRKVGVTHKKFVIKKEIKEIDFKVTPFKDSSGDAFNLRYKDILKGFYKKDNEFKVLLGGNGGDTDWEFGENRIADVDKTNIQSFIPDYARKMSIHPLIKDIVQKQFADEIETYFLNKYALLGAKGNWQQLLASAFFHLERFRGQQGFIYTQISNKQHDVFAPFAIESFNQLVFLANKKQLQRGSRQGIHYRLSQELTGGKIPYAPILTSANEHGNGIFQKFVNKVMPYIPKIIWKLNNGDTNTRIRQQYQIQVNVLYQNYLKENKDSEIFNYIDKDQVFSEIDKSNYTGKYNAIGSMIETIKQNKH